MFGNSILIDMLGTIIALLLTAKVAASLVLLTRRRETWFSNRQSEKLWWVTKIAPLLVAPCFLLLGIVQQSGEFIVAALFFTVFVAVAVPIKIRRAYYKERR